MQEDTALRAEGVHHSHGRCCSFLRVCFSLHESKSYKQPGLTANVVSTLAVGLGLGYFQDHVDLFNITCIHDVMGQFGDRLPVGIPSTVRASFHLKRFILNYALIFGSRDLRYGHKNHDTNLRLHPSMCHEFLSQ